MSRHGFANVRRGLNLSAGTGIGYTGTMVLSNSNGVTFGMSASASSEIVTVSYTGVGITAAIQSISAGTTQATMGQVVFSNSNGISFGANGQTITAQLVQEKFWNNRIAGDQILTAGTGSGAANLSLQRVTFLDPIAATRADLIASWSTGNSFSLSLAMYTFAGSTASSVSSASMAVTATSGNDGIRWRSFALGTWSVTAGEYLIGLMASVPTGSLSIFGSASAASIMAPGGGDYTNYFANGILSAGTGAFPASIHLSAINQTQSAVGAPPGQPYIQLAGTY